MNSYLVVLPVLDEQIAQPCMESLADPNSAAGFSPNQIIVVDNTKDGMDKPSLFPFQYYRDPFNHNLGVARSWNVGARKVLDEGLEYLVILSACMTFGPELHTTFLKQMQSCWGEPVIEANGHSWHLIAIHRSIFEKVGLFDENFYPAYVEQIDFGYRMRMLGLEHSFKQVWVNAMSRGVGMHHPLISCPAKPLLALYRKKWGGDKGEEQFVLPYGERTIDYWRTKSIDQLAAEYELGEKGKDWW